MNINDFFIRVTLLTPLALGTIHMVLLIGEASLTPIHKNRWFEVLASWLGNISLFASVLLLVFSIERTSNYTISYDDSYLFLKFPIDIHVDALSLYFVMIVNSVTLVATWNSIGFLKNHMGANPSRTWFQNPLFFHGSINLFHFTMVLVPVVNNLVLLWIAIELTTVVSALLVGFLNKRASWEAAWKYMIITTTGVVFALLGTMFLANATSDFLTKYGDAQNHPEYQHYKSLLEENKVLGGHDPASVTNAVMNWTFLRDLAKAGGFNENSSESTVQEGKKLLENGEERFLILSFLFVIIGYGTKAGFAPMHTWLPDGHGEAPAPISALLSGVLLKSAVYAILRYFTLVNIVMGDSFPFVLFQIIGLVSLLVATPLILKRKQPFKRVLAYHSVEHMGLIALGIGIGGPGVGGKIAIFGALFHILNHALTKSLMFMTYGDLITIYGHLNITGVLRRLPNLSAILTLGGLTLVGMPPFSIFLSEFIIGYGGLYDVVNNVVNDKSLNGFNVLSIVSIALFTISTVAIFIGLTVHLSTVILDFLPYKTRMRRGRARKDSKKSASIRVNPRLISKMYGRNILKKKAASSLATGRKVDQAPLIILLFFVLSFGFGMLPALSRILTASTNIILAGK